MSKRIIFSESPDGAIEGLKTAKNGNSAEAQVVFSFDNSDHFDYFQERIQEGSVRFDLRSRIAQLGYNFVPAASFSKPIITLHPSKAQFTIEGTLYPWMKEALPTDYPWHLLFEPPAFKLGKLVNLGKDLHGNPLLISQANLESRLKEDETHGVDILFHTGSEIVGDTIRLALDGRTYFPNPSSMKLNDILQAFWGPYQLSRERINELRLPPDRSLPIIVQAKGGIVAHTVVKSTELSVAVSTEQPNGVKHSSAFYASPHSAISLFLELMGNGTTDTAVTHVNAQLYRSDEKIVQEKIYVPVLNFPPKKTPIKPINRSFNIHTQNTRRPFKVSPYSPESLRKFDNFVRGNPKGTFYYSYTFPSPEIMDKLQSYAAERRVGAVVFSMPPIANKSFNREHYERMKRMSSSYGTLFVWESDHYGTNIFHKDIGFMTPSMRPIMDKAVNSNSILLVMISHRDVNARTMQNLDDAFTGHKLWTGGEEGYGTIGNGGGPGGMTQVLHLAQSKTMYTLTVNLVKEGEYQAYDAHRNPSAAFKKIKVDCFMPYQMGEVNSRQGNLLGLPGPKIVAEGGVGTFFEFYEMLTKAGFNSLLDPIFLLGDKAFFQYTLDQLDVMNKRNRINPRILHNVHLLEDGKEYLPLVKRHYELAQPKIILPT